MVAAAGVEIAGEIKADGIHRMYIYRRRKTPYGYITDAE